MHNISNCAISTNYNIFYHFALKDNEGGRKEGSGGRNTNASRKPTMLPIKLAVERVMVLTKGGEK
jgi:hypothetical protein